MIWEIIAAKKLSDGWRKAHMVAKRFERFKPPSGTIYPETQQNISPGEKLTTATIDKVPNMSPALALTKFQRPGSQTYHNGVIQSGIV